MATHLTRYPLDATADSGYSKKWTWSGWVKRAKLGAEQGIMGNKRNDNNVNSRFKLYFRSTDKLGWECKDSGGSDDSSFETNALFRDVNCWYHITFIYDSDNSTATERIKCYVNGLDVRTEYGGFSSDNQASSGFGTLWSSAVANYLGTSGNNSGIAMQFEGCMSHCHLTYGYRYEASTFGSFDNVTGEWKINTDPSVTYGSQGYFLLKDGNSVTDQSGQGNNYTATGDLTKTEDCPSTVYATANPLVRNQVTITTANLTVRSPSSNWMGIPATLGVSSGKWYWEYKLALGNAWSQCGVMSSKPNGGYDGIYSTYVGANSGGLALNSGNGDFYHDGSSGAYGTSAWFGSGLAEYDIIGVALDATNSKIWFSQNGTWGNSSNPSTDSGGIDFSGDADFTSYKPYFPAFSMHNCILTLNFGNGYLGTSEITTNGGNGFQDTDGNGRFYYAVPTNYRGLSTKGLNA
jgi:hypothetical protein